MRLGVDRYDEDRKGLLAAAGKVFLSIYGLETRLQVEDISKRRLEDA